MKKTLIALALTALPVAAMADVTLYGQIKGGINVENKKVTTVGNTRKATYDGNTSSQTIVRDYGSRIGFKGEEDLGNGLKTIWQVEQSVSLGGDTKKGWSNRQTFIGLEGAFGKVRVGNLDTVFKSDMEEIDAWEYAEDNGTSALGLAQFTRVDQRHKASIRYDSPNFAGFGFNVQYATKADEALLDSKHTSKINSKYAQQNYYVGANQANLVGEFSGRDFEKVTTKKGSDAWFLGLNYENSGFFAKYGFGQYSKNTLASNTSYVAATDNVTNTGYQVNASNRYRDGSIKNTQVHRLTLGYDANNLFVAGSYQYTKGADTLAGLRGTFGAGNAQVVGDGVNQLALDRATTFSNTSNPTIIDVNRPQAERFSNYALALGDGVKRSEVALAAAYTMGAITPKITYAHGFDMKTLGNYGKLGNTKYDQIIVGADYALSKRTTALVSAGWLRQGLGYSYSIDNPNAPHDEKRIVEHKDKYKNTSFSVGLKHVF